MVGLPITLSLRLETDLALSSQLENKVTLLVQVCQFLEFLPFFLCVLQKCGINQVAHLSALIDVKSPKALATIKFSIYDVPFHNNVFLVNKFKFVPVAVYFCSAADDDAPVLVAVIAACDAALVHLYVPIPFIGN